MHCLEDVETKFISFVFCPMFTAFRKNIFCTIPLVKDTPILVSDNDKIIFLMSSQKTIMNCVAKYIFSAFMLKETKT